MHCAFRNTRATPTKSQRIEPSMWTASVGRRGEIKDIKDIKDALCENLTCAAFLGLPHVSHMSDVSHYFCLPLVPLPIMNNKLGGCAARKHVRQSMCFSTVSHSACQSLCTLALLWRWSIDSLPSLRTNVLLQVFAIATLSRSGHISVS